MSEPAELVAPSLASTGSQSAASTTPTGSQVASSAPIESQGVATTPSERSSRKKVDAAWKYVTEISHTNGKKAYICNLCQKKVAGGGITRMKRHLAGVKGDVGACKSVTPEIQYEIKCILNATSQEVLEKKGFIEDLTLDERNNVPSNDSVSGRKRQAISEIDSCFQNGASDPSQPSIKACMQSAEKWKDTDLSIALWFSDACIPFNAVNSPYLQLAIDKIASMGHGYKHPSFYALRVSLLNDAKRHVGLIVQSIRNTWSDTGCIIMGDWWTDTRQRPLINFLVYSPKGITFIKFVDASDIYTNAENLCNLLSEIVEMVGPENVVHMVTDNGANYKAVGSLLMDKYESIYLSPCAAHCINLILKDVAEMPHVKDVVTLASQITVFVYNHKLTLNWLRKRPGWREIIRPGGTRFATSFIALQSLYDHKDDLEALVVSNEFKQFMKIRKAKDVRETVLSLKFWDNCLIVVKAMTPIMRLLRLCDTDERPSLGYIYEGMHRARTGIMKIFQNRPELYEPYTDIIDWRWDRMLRKDLHAASYFLNPAFQYDPTSVCNESEIMRGILNLLDKVEKAEEVEDKSSNVMLEELRIFRGCEKCFARPKALACNKTTHPNEWWRIFGYDAPNLGKVAIKILSQPASSSGCERNWNVFERIHSKKRNILEHERLNDLVYIHYNL